MKKDLFLLVNVNCKDMSLKMFDENLQKFIEKCGISEKDGEFLQLYVMSMVSALEQQRDVAVDEYNNLNRKYCHLLDCLDVASKDFDKKFKDGTFEL